MPRIRPIAAAKVVAVVAVVGLAGCSGHGRSAAVATTASSTTTTSVVAGACLPGGATLRAVVASGLDGSARGQLSDVYVVRSANKVRTYYVVGEIAVSGRSERGLWVSTADDGSGAVFSVNAAALASSSWHDAAKTAQHYRATDPAAVTALGCP